MVVMKRTIRDQTHLQVHLQGQAHLPQGHPHPALGHPQGIEGREAIGLGPDLCHHNQREAEIGQGHRETGSQDTGGRDQVLLKTVGEATVDQDLTQAAIMMDQGGQGIEHSPR